MYRRELCGNPRPKKHPPQHGVFYDPRHKCGAWADDGHTMCTWAGLVVWPRYGWTEPLPRVTRKPQGPPPPPPREPGGHTRIIPLFVDPLTKGRQG